MSQASQELLQHPVGPVIDGVVRTNSRPTHEIFDPATGEVSYEAAQCNDRDIDDAIESAARAYKDSWSQTPPAERGRLMLRVAALIRSNAEELTHAETLDTGKPLNQARSDVETAARYFEFYAGAADKIGGVTIPLPSGTFAYTTREPLGVVAHITPWNSPISQLCRGVAPSLAAGNTVVVKPASITPSTTVRLALLIVQAGLPSGVYNVVVGSGSAGSAITAHPLVEHVTFTGSVQTGRKVGEVAARRVIGSTLELGGKSATLVFPDADLDRATTAGANAVVRNAGQSCFATTRQLVHASIYDQYLEQTAQKMQGLVVGPGVDDPDLGPLASASQQSQVQNMVNNALGEGARLANEPDMGLLDRAGYYHPPVLLADVENNMEIAQTEVFGPVQTVIPFETEEEAVEIANGTVYGLAAGIFSRDVERVHRLAPQLQAGQIQVNKYPMGGVEIPFGGYKESGLGREKGLVALENYTQIKTVMVTY